MDGDSTPDNPDPTLHLGHNKAPKPAKARPKFQRQSPPAKKIKLLQTTTEPEEEETNTKEPKATCIAFRFIVSLLFVMIRKLKAEKKCLETENLKLKIEVGKLKKTSIPQALSFSYTSVKSDKEISFFTGLPSLKMFEALHAYVAPFVNKRWKGYSQVVNKVRHFVRSPKKFGPGRKMNSKDEFLLTLMKLRLGLLYQDLAHRFGISKSLSSQVFHSWLTAMTKVLGHLVWFAPKDNVQMSKPKRFNCMPKLRSIVDASEIFIETPKDPKLQCSTYSSYKHHNTAKFLIACAPNSCITFVSPMYGGRASDKEITLVSGFLDLHESYDTILADKGFNIADECAARRITIQVPPGLRGQAQMSSHAVEKTKRVANLRILIEQVIRRLKTYRILSGEVPVTLVPHLYKIVKVCAALTNIKCSIYKK